MARRSLPPPLAGALRSAGITAALVAFGVAVTVLAFPPLGLGGLGALMLAPIVATRAPAGCAACPRPQRPDRHPAHSVQRDGHV